MLSVKNEVIAFDTKANGGFPAKENESEDVTVLRELLAHGFENAPELPHLFTTAKEEFVGVNSVGHSTSNEWHPMEDDWRLMGVAEQ